MVFIRMKVPNSALSAARTPSVRMSSLPAPLFAVLLLTACPHDFARSSPPGAKSDLQGSQEAGSQEGGAGHDLHWEDPPDDGGSCVGKVCGSPPGPCYENLGTCSDTGCVYKPLLPGVTCDLGDKCIPSASCDGNGACKGQPLDCSQPNTTGGTCVAGACSGYKCNPGWGNCSGSWDDGCETDLTSTTNCGKCGNKCGSVDNATVKCTSSKCALTCKAPYKDCDGIYNNGCEIPAGMANRCNKKGLALFSGGTPPCGLMIDRKSFIVCRAIKETGFGLLASACLACHAGTGGAGCPGARASRCACPPNAGSEARTG